MPQDSSLVGMFDLNSQPGVMSVLASVRASTLTTAEKNELRDLVFLYTNGGGDPSVKISLEQKLTAHGIVPVALKKSGVAGPTLSFGSYRPTPNFKAPVVTNTSKNPPVVAVPTPAQNQVPVSASVPTPTPVSPVAAPVPLAQIAPTPAPIPAPVTTAASPVSVTLTPTPTPSATPAVPDAPVPVAQNPVAVAPLTQTGEVNYLERIRQIKTAVNSKVGNPVNLVDIDNQVGREYMNALLEAMKKLSAGAVSEMDPAMQRLEAAFAAVEVAIKNHAAKDTALPTPAPQVNVQVPLPPTPPVVPAPEPVMTQPATPVSVPTPPPVLPQVTQTPSKLEPPFPVPASETIPTAPVVSTEPRSTIPLASIPTVVRPELLHKEAGMESGFEKSTLNAATPVNVPAPASASLAESNRILTPTDLPDAASLQTGEKGDPLFTKEVDDGLNQLLSDWTLFKKSGLFGTGPKGREHPLFKKIADLQVPLLLAGRFDGATQEIRQSVTDYMNGWRYEQGIIYQPGETFEKYLRRVIKHILDLQKKRK